MSWLKNIFGKEDQTDHEIFKAKKPKYQPNLTSEQSQKLLGKFILVEGGEFTMGSPESEVDRLYNETEHKVKINTFYIQETVVTQEMWEQVMGKNPSSFKDWGDMPVTNVSWYDVVEYCNKLSELAGLQKCYSKNQSGDILCNWLANGYRLPTEAEWEYAAKGGNKSKGFKYSGSDYIEEVAWYDLNSDEKLHRVKEKKPNELGIYDMSGNVWEWCWDWFNEYNIEAQIDDNPKGPSVGSARVFRGGGWCGDASCCRCVYRSFSTPDYSFIFGFRLVSPSK